MSTEAVEKLTKDSILQAIARIDEEGYPSKRESSTYRLIYNDKSYPPKYVASLAGYFCNETYIPHTDFRGGYNTPLFNRLRKLGFTILSVKEASQYPSAKRVSASVHLKYIGVQEGVLDEETVFSYWNMYVDYCKRSKWLTYREAYKFKFGKWMQSKMDTNVDTERLYSICMESQETAFSDEGIGINFIRRQRDSYGKEFITTDQCEAILTASNYEEIEKSLNPDSWPVFSVFAGTVRPEIFSIYGNTSQLSILGELFQESNPSSGFNAFQYAMRRLQELKSYLIQQAEETIEDLLGIQLGIIQDISSEWNWMVQDFLLFIDRRIINYSPNYFWVNQGQNYAKERDLGIIRAPIDALHHHKTMQLCQEGDIILHYSKGALQATSVVQREFSEEEVAYEPEKGEQWVVRTNYSPLKEKVDLEEIQALLRNNRDLLPKRYSPINSKLSVNQSYLHEIPRELFELLAPQANQPTTEIRPSNPTTMKTATNRIYFGPPGTGKTYTLKNEIYDEYITPSEQVNVQDVLFREVTELTWWQVCALGLIETGPCSPSVLATNRWVKSKIDQSDSKNPGATIRARLQVHARKKNEHIAYKKRRPPLIFDKTESGLWSISQNTFEQALPDLNDIKESIDNFTPEKEEAKERFVFTTFHQSFTYEDFVEGIKPVLADNESDSDSTDLQYEIKDGVFKQLCNRAKNDQDNRYAIFIDEINRGNVASIFGELITLIEPDKREGKENEISVILPYSKKPFSVPANLDIYGTMNTADRSVEALDSALRRRFEFVETPSKPEVLNIVVDEISLKGMLQNLNNRLTYVRDKDHTIGHAYFMNVSDIDDLRTVFVNKVVPLLEEYFFNAPEEIIHILGERFKEAITNPWSGQKNGPEGLEDQKIRVVVPSGENFKLAMLELAGQPLSE